MREVGEAMRAFALSPTRQWLRDYVRSIQEAMATPPDPPAPECAPPEAVSPELAPSDATPTRNKGGTPPKYDWDAAKAWWRERIAKEDYGTQDDAEADVRDNYFLVVHPNKKPPHETTIRDEVIRPVLLEVKQGKTPTVRTAPKRGKPPR
jgi:hypothetical protein